MLNQILSGVFFTLTQLVTLVGVPGTRLLDDVVLDTEVDEASLARDSGAVQNVKLCLLERRRHLVLDDLDSSPVTDGVGPLLQSLNPSNIEAHGRIELQSLTTGGGFGASEEDTDLFPQLVDEDHCGPGLVETTGQLPKGLRHQSGLQTDVAVTHVTFDFGTRNQRCHRVDDDEVHRTRAHQHVGDFERLLTGVGL